MRLDPKYFNRFIFYAALLGAALIVVFTLWQQDSREKAFNRQLDKYSDSLPTRYLKLVGKKDSIQIQQFDDRWVVLDFWSTWAPQSKQSHKVLDRFKKRYEDELVVISAASQDPINKINEYRNKHKYPFYFVEGRVLYKDLHPPGVPTQIVFGPEGKVQDILLGYRDSTQYDRLIEGLKNMEVPN